MKQKLSPLVILVLTLPFLLFISFAWSFVEEAKRLEQAAKRLAQRQKILSEERAPENRYRYGKRTGI